MWIVGIKFRSTGSAASKWLSHLTGPGIVFQILTGTNHLDSSHWIHQALLWGYSNAFGLTPGQADWIFYGVRGTKRALTTHTGLHVAQFAVLGCLGSQRKKQDVCSPRRHCFSTVLPNVKGMAANRSSCQETYRDQQVQIYLWKAKLPQYQKQANAQLQYWNVTVMLQLGSNRQSHKRTRSFTLTPVKNVSETEKKTKYHPI